MSKALIEGLVYGGNLRFKIDWASLIFGRKFTVFALFYFAFEGNFRVQAPWGGAYIWRGDLTEGFFCVTGLRGLNVVGLIFGILRYVTCILSYSSSVYKLITLHNILQVKGAAPRNLPKFKK